MAQVKYDEVIFTVAEAAKFRNVPEKTIRAAIKNGRLRYLKTVGHIGVRLEDVKACNFHNESDESTTQNEIENKIEEKRSSYRYASVSAEESLKWMDDFPKRRDAFIAAIRESKD